MTFEEKVPEKMTVMMSDIMAAEEQKSLNSEKNDSFFFENCAQYIRIDPEKNFSPRKNIA